jgi:peptidoglycan hydrolase-like protein with peptidoglycan-binding domain
VAGFQLTERGNRLVDDVLNRPLCVGDRSDEVKLLQKRLQIRVDGVFGEQTRDAVINFQLGNGLIPDGVVGPQTRLHLIF